MATSAVATLLTQGLRACTNALTSGLPLQVSKWELGSAAATEVTANVTSAIPQAIYTGSASTVLLEQENGVAVFNIVLNETVGDYFVGNLALKVIDPVTNLEVLLAVVMFPEAVYKLRSVVNGGVDDTGNYYLVKLAINLSTSQSIATVQLTNSTFSMIPSVDSVKTLGDTSNTTYPHQILLRAPETGAPALIAKRPGDGVWWGFSLSWPVDSHEFGVVSGGYQGDWYDTTNVDVLFGGYFHFTDDDYVEVISGGVNWEGIGSNVNTVDGGTWS